MNDEELKRQWEIAVAAVRHRQRDIPLSEEEKQSLMVVDSDVFKALFPKESVELVKEGLLPE